MPTPERASCCDVASRRMTSPFAALYHNVGGLEFSRGRYRTAERLARWGLAIRRKHVGSGHPAVAADLSALASILYGQKRYQAALRASSTARQIFSARRRLARFRYDLAVIDNNIGATLQALEKYDEAERYYLSSLKLKKHVLGPRHPDVGISLNNLGELYRRQGRVAEASTAYLSAIEILRQALGPRHPHTIGAIANYRRSLAPSIRAVRPGRGRASSRKGRPSSMT